MNKEALIAWVEARLSERSTWLGAISLLGDLGVHIAPGQSALITTIGVALAGAIMVFTKDHNVTTALTTVVEGFVEGEKEAKAAQANAVANTTTTAE